MEPHEEDPPEEVAGDADRAAVGEPVERVLAYGAEVLVPVEVRETEDGLDTKEDQSQAGRQAHAATADDERADWRPHVHRDEIEKVLKRRFADHERISYGLAQCSNYNIK